MSGAVSCVNRKREALEPASKAATRELSLCICSDTSAEFILSGSNGVFGFILYALQAASSCNAGIKGKFTQSILLLAIPT
jgi:hypothetical protein